MKRKRIPGLVCLLSVLFLPIVVSAQDEPRAAWQVTNFDITVNNLGAERGSDYAPFRITVTGVNAISSGTEKSASGNSVFEQSLNGQPFFVAGTWDRVEGNGNAKGVTALLPKGATPDEQKQAEMLIAL